METTTLKWPEIFSLAGLNAAIVISWIAYHEYQPVLVSEFGLGDLTDFLFLSKALILVLTPPVAGWFADYLLRRSGKYFTVFTIGISLTAMVFMVVASIIGAGPLSAIQGLLPYMIVIWLIAMNLFVSPANSMIDSFAPVQKLPVVMGVLFLITELLYALEPLIIGLVHFFGDTLTFVVGGILIGGSGFLFHRISSNEVISRRKAQQSHPGSTSFLAIVTVLMVGLLLGLAKAILVEYLPEMLNEGYPGQGIQAETLVFLLLGFSALLGFGLSRVVTRYKLENVILIGLLFLLIGGVMLLPDFGYSFTVLGAVLLAVAFSMLNIAGLPFTVRNMSVRNITYGVGVYLGAAEVFSGILENLG